MHSDNCREGVILVILIYTVSRKIISIDDAVNSYLSLVFQGGFEPHSHMRAPLAGIAGGKP